MFLNCVRCQLFTRLPGSRPPPKDRDADLLSLNLADPIPNDLAFRENLVRAAGGYSICGEFFSAAPADSMAEGSTEQASQGPQDTTAGPDRAPTAPLARKSCVPGNNDITNDNVYST